MILKLLHLPLRGTLLQASIPFLLYSLICCLEVTLHYDNSILQSSKDILLGLYSSYPLFMAAMLILNALIDGCKIPGSIREAEPAQKGNRVIPQVIRSCLCYTLIYACFQLGSLSLPQQEVSGNLSVGTINGLKEFPRILKEKGGGDEAYVMRDTSLRESGIELFEVGKIIGSRPIQNSAMTISKDGKTIFLIEESRAVLRIVDISDNQNPKMLSTLALKSKSGSMRSLLLSADEKILYTSRSIQLEIVDISNPKSPLLLGSFIDPDVEQLRGKTDINLIFFVQTSMALSWNEKTLYVGGGAFQIFSVENPKQPQLIFSSAASSPNRTLFPTSVTTSADGRTLYFANSTVGVYNISADPNNPKVIDTFPGASSINSLLLGKDNKTLYAAGMNGEMVTLEKIAIEEKSPFLKSLETFNLGISSGSPPAILEKSFSESTLFLFTTTVESEKDTTYGFTSRSTTFRAYNLVAREILSHSKDLFPNSRGALRVIPNTRNFAISKDDQLNIVSFFSNYPNLHSFGLSNNTYEVYKPPGRTLLFSVPSSLGTDRLYTITVTAPGPQYYFNIIEMSNKRDPEILVSFPLDIEASFLRMVENANRVFAIDRNNVIQVLDFSDLSQIQSLGFVSLESPDSNKFYPLNDGKTALTYFMDNDKTVTQLKMLDFSNLSSIKIIANEEIDKSSDGSMVQVSSQGIIFLCLKTEVLIYNLSAPASSRRIASIAFPSAEQSLVRCRLFEEKGLIFLETHNQDTMHYLSIVNVSETTSPKMLSIIPLPKFKKDNLIPAIISSDVSKAYFWDLRHLLVIDLSDIRSPLIIGQIPSPWLTVHLPKFYLSGDNKFGYFESLGIILMIDLQMKYTLYMNNNNFALGKKYTTDFMLLHLNEKSHFESFDESDYKIIKLSLSQISLGEGYTEAQTTFSPLPDWISFNYLGLNIESKNERDLGNYTLFSGCSLKVPFEAFSFIGNSSDVEDLVATLVSLGFLDSQRFLTPSFGNKRDFLIQSQYSAHKSEIYETLKQYYFQTFTPFSLQPSLEMRTQEQFMKILTPSLDVIKVDIKLKYNPVENDKENPQFLSRPYGSIVPVITEHKTRLRIEGLLTEVNMALAKLVVNNKLLECDGEVIITDNLNQPLVKDVKEIVKYFTSNKPPRVSLGVQQQIDMVPVYTGEFVTVALNTNTFIDDNVEKLNYKLVMNTPERHDKPSWIVFSNDLVMKITAPEQLLNREVKLLIIAENEFEKVEVPFVLKIKLSPVYLLKVLIMLSPYILTIIGLYIKANKIYNIVFQKRYKHPQEFFVEIEKEMEIPPIWFIAEEKKESRIIMQKICNKVARDLGCSESDREKLVDYFWDFTSGELDTEKLRQVIEEIVGQTTKKELKLYLSEGKARKSLIHQMIEDKLVLWRLDLKQEKNTKGIYNKMKDSWVDLLKWDNSKNQFVIQQEMFDTIFGDLAGGGVSSLKDSTAGDSICLTQVTHDEPLLKKTDDQRINVDLLKKSLLILAFENYSLDMKGIKAYVKVKQREESSCLKRILREDLVNVSFSHKGTTGYGIMYKIAGDRLEFTGAPEKHLEDETIVVQITNSHERILKEIWIHGVSDRNEVRSEMMMMKSYGVL